MNARRSGASLRERLVAELERGRRLHHQIDRLASALRTDRKSIDALVDELVAAGTVVRTRKGKIALASRLGYVTGTLRVTRRGKAIVIPDSADVPVAISRGATAGAMDGDRVLVEASPYTRRGLRTGAVRKVLERRTQRLVGTLVRGRRGAVVFVPRSSSARYVAAVDNPERASGEDRLVEARIVEYPTAARGPTVHIERELGQAGTLAGEIVAVASALGIPRSFSSAAEREASRFGEPQPTPDRLDLRRRLLMTIDPADAKDFDDAIGIERRRHGYRATVAIADVSHYVRPGTALDEEAFDRGTSVYFPGDVSPMLPEALSAHLASLEPGTDRYAVVVLLDIDSSGVVRGQRFSRALVRSKRRLTYEEAQELLEASKPPRGQEKIASALRALAELAGLLYRRRVARGAIDLEIPELEVHVGADGKPEAIRRRPRLATHRIVEELMLAANEAVAAALTAASVPLIYRIHERPDEEAVATLAARLSLLGLRLEPGAGGVEPRAFQQVVDKVRGKPLERLVHTMCLRAMKQARYSAFQAEHFGLASSCYTHFTSPIRRYPDLVVHRQLCRWLEGKDTRRTSPEQLEPVAAHCSERERRAMEAEREAARAAAVIYAQEHVGSVFRATVVGVERRGYWVELDDLGVEGFVPVGRLSEYFDYVEERMELHARRSRRVIRIGTRQRVRIESADLAERRIELTPIER